jgi:hypothetical protein
MPQCYGRHARNCPSARNATVEDRLTLSIPEAVPRAEVSLLADEGDPSQLENSLRALRGAHGVSGDPYQSARLPPSELSPRRRNGFRDERQRRARPVVRSAGGLSVRFPSGKARHHAGRGQTPPSAWCVFTSNRQACGLSYVSCRESRKSNSLFRRVAAEMGRMRSHDQQLHLYRAEPCGVATDTRSCSTLRIRSGTSSSARLN